MRSSIDHTLLMDPLIDRIEKLLTKRNAWITVSILSACTLLFAFALRNVRLDHDFEKFFPTNDTELDRYLAFRERFGNDNDFLLVAAEHRPSIFDREFLQSFDSLGKELAALDDIIQLNSPTELEDPRITPFGVFRVPWLRLGSDSTLQADSARIWNDPQVRDAFFAEDGQALLLIAQTAPGLSKEASDALMRAVQAVVDRSSLSNVRMGGRIHGQYWYIQKMQFELILFFCISAALLTLFLYVGFRTAWGVLVPIGVVSLSVLWQVGMITLLGKPISVLTMLLPTILFVVGMSDVVHLLERYIEALRRGFSKQRALAITYREVGMATFLTSVTTAIGFATLVTSNIIPIREFGVYTATGVVLAFLLAFTLLPAVLILVPTPLQASTSEQKATWYPFLHGAFRRILKYRRAIPWSFAVVVLLATLAAFNLKVNNYLLEDWPEDDPQKQDYYWFESHFGGVRGFEMEFAAKDSTQTLWNLDALREMETVQAHIQEHYGVKALISPVTVVKAINKARNGGDQSFNQLPETEADLQRLLKYTKQLGGADALASLITADGKYARLTGRMEDEGGHVHARKNKELDRFIAEHTRTVSMQQTGMAYLIDLNNEKLSGQLIGGLSIALLLIGGIMAWVFRDLRMTLISLIPNTIPLIVIAGLMGISGIDIKVSTSIIFTIAFGIAVDDTIHLLGKLKIELDKGRSLPFAMKRAFLSAGKAVLVTTIMLCSGFVALIFSDFGSVFYLGVLVSSALALAVVTDLLLLPILVLFFFRERRTKV